MTNFPKIRKKISLNPLFRAALLISLKEFYLFLRNLLGLFVHPFKTIVRIRKKPDWSQTILVLGLPVWGGLGVVGVLGLVLVGLWLLRPVNQVLVKAIFAGMGLILLGILGVLGYVGFWVRKYLVWKKRATLRTPRKVPISSGPRGKLKKTENAEVLEVGEREKKPRYYIGAGHAKRGG